MNALFGEPIDAIRWADIETVVRDAIPEGQMVELKAELPAKGKRDPWYENQQTLSESARNRILPELIAFANTDGGVLLLGIGETDDHPRRAASITPIPKCHDLAVRLRQMCDSCIEPPLPILEVVGISPNGTDSGVIIIRVAASRRAPHRLDVNNHSRECYVRRGDKTEKMTMTEIRDKVFQSASSVEEAKNRLLARSRANIHLHPSNGFRSDVRESTVRATTMPFASQLELAQPHKHPELVRLINSVPVGVEQKNDRLHFPDISLNERGVRPMLRAAYREERDDPDSYLRQELHADGLSEIFYRTARRNGGLAASWILSIALNSLLVAERARRYCGVPNTELVLEVEMYCAVARANERGFDYTEMPFSALLGREFIQTGPLRATLEPLKLPALTITSVEDVPSAMNILYEDLLTAFGLEPQQITIPPVSEIDDR